MSKRWRIGFDIGGTSADFVLLGGDQNAIRLHKCLTPQDPSEGALHGLDQLLADADVMGWLRSSVGRHSSHVRSSSTPGAKLGLITTAR